MPKKPKLPRVGPTLYHPRLFPKGRTTVHVSPGAARGKSGKRGGRGGICTLKDPLPRRKFNATLPGTDHGSVGGGHTRVGVFPIDSPKYRSK